MNTGVNNNNVSSVNLSDRTSSDKEPHNSQQYQHNYRDFVNNNVSANGLDPQYYQQPQSYHQLQQNTDRRVSQSANMTDYGNMNSATSAMANMNLVGYSQMNNAAVQQQQQQQQQQYAASMQSNMNGMPNNGSMIQNQQSMTANNSAANHQIASLPSNMALSYVNAPQNVQQQQQNVNSSSLTAAAAAYYNAMQNSYHLAPTAASTAALQAAFTSPTPQSGTASMMSMGSGGNGGSSSAMSQSTFADVTPMYSVANPHNDYIWGARDAFPLRQVFAGLPVRIC